jgi:UDP-2,3-diacylglucosamine pyrophosphatase LpxH
LEIKNKYKAIIVSDLHLGTKDSKAKEFLQFLETHSTDLLILNGDIIDGWAIKRGSKLKNHHIKVIAKLLKYSKKTNVVWIRGNHDDFLKDFIGSKLGNIEICEDYRLENFVWDSYDTMIPKHYYIFHGDVIDVFITKYKWLAKIGSIGYDLALWINRWYNRYREWKKLPYKSISKDIKSGVKSATNYINDFEINAIKMAQKNNCYGVICGHIHQPADRIINNSHYLNSGDWVENRTAILLDFDNNFSVFSL